MKIQKIFLTTLLVIINVGCNSRELTNLPDKPEVENQEIQTFKLSKKNLSSRIIIPGEIKAYESVDVFSKIKGFIEKIYVDKGSIVKKGQLLISLSIPELSAEVNAAESNLESLKAQYQRLKTANATPGVISENELDISEKNYLKALANLKALQETNTYTEIRAPFDGIITERNVHTGALVGNDDQNTKKALLHIDQISTLRIIVPVPEYAIRSISHGKKIKFTVSAFPGKEFYAEITRNPVSIDRITRTQNIELDYNNSKLLLAPGMYPEIEWDLLQDKESFVVPKTALSQEDDKLVLIKLVGDKYKKIPVKTGYHYGKELEVFGELSEEDILVLNIDKFDLGRLEKALN